MYELIAQGSILNVGELASYDSYLAERQRGLLELDLRLPVSQSVANELEAKLREAGVEEVRVTTASPMLRIYFRKGMPWLAVIAAAILGLLTLAILIVGWRLFREVVGVIPAPIQPIAMTAVIIIMLILALAFARRRVT